MCLHARSGSQNEYAGTTLCYSRQALISQRASQVWVLYEGCPPNGMLVFLSERLELYQLELYQLGEARESG